MLYKNYLKKLAQNLKSEITLQNAEEIKKEFWQTMEYEIFHSYTCQYTNDSSNRIYRYQVEKKLLFWICSGNNIKKYLNMMQQELSFEGACEWGILIHQNGLWLFNRDISVSNNDDFRAKKIVFVITFSPKRDDDYFEYFSYDNLFGRKKNAYFFRDIINYKNTIFSGTSKSWIAYHTALKRFFSFYCNSVGNYQFKGNPYDDIQLRHFKAYIDSRNSIKSKETVRNQYFYVRDFISKKSVNKDYTISSKEILNKLDAMPDRTTSNIQTMDFAKIRTAIKWIQKKENYNSVRNITLILFILTFGTERRKLCQLKWENISDDFLVLNIGKVPKTIPEHLRKWLRALKKEELKNEKSRNAIYVFGNRGSDFKTPLEENRINEILTDFSKADPNDDFYKLLTPQNIRKWLFHHLLETRSLQDAIEFMDISLSNLSSYLSQSELSKYVTNDFLEKYPLDDLAKELEI